MPGFPCDNSGGDFIPDEMYDSVRYTIELKTKELGRYLTKEEVEACFLEDGFDPPDNCYKDAYGDDEGEEGYVRIKFEPKLNQPDDDDKLGNLNQEQISTQQNSTDELQDSEPLSPKMAAYWRIFQEIAQESGVTATLIPQKRVPSTTTKTQFVFLEKGSDSKK
jgi:hypothetical protein